MKSRLTLLGLFSCVCLAGFAEGIPSLAKKSAEGGGAARYVFEAEEFDDLPFYGNWYYKSDLGWYTKEHRHASGRALVVCDDLNSQAAMTKRLDPPVQPGEVKVFVRVALMRMGPGNQVKVSLGNFKGETFVEEESVYYKWRLGNGFGWLGQNLDLKKACSTIWVQPVTIGCQGIGDVPEVPQAQVLLDSFVITNERLARLIPDPTGRGRTRLELPELAGTTTSSPGTEATDHIARSVSMLKSGYRALKRPARSRSALDAPSRAGHVPAGNLVPNGSFEYSLKPNWYARPNYLHGYDIGIENRDPHLATHGRYCLKLPLTPMNFTRTGDKAVFGADILCRPFPVKPNTSYWLSFNARSSQAGVTLGSSAGAFKLGVRWSNLTTKVKSGADQSSFSLTFAARAQQPGETIWLDEVEMKEVGPSVADEKNPPAKFDVWGQFEVGLRVDVPGAIFYDDAPVELTIVAANSRMSAREDVLQIRVLDSEGELVGAVPVPLRVPPYDLHEEKLSLKSRRRGAFLAVYWLEESPQPAGKLAFCVVPNPAAVFGKKPFIGTYAQSVEAAMKQCARLGFDWNAPLNDRIFRADYVTKRMGVYEWFDHLVKRWKEHGIDFVGEVLPNEKPRWDDGVLGTQPAAGVSQPFFVLDIWRTQVRQMVSHYTDVTDWILADEAEVHRTAEDFAPYVKVAYEEVKKANRDARVMFSARAELVEQVYQLLGTHKVQDVYGGSRFMAGKWVHKKDLAFCRKYSLPIWHTGVGYPSIWLYGLLDAQDEMVERNRAELRQRLNAQAFDLMLQTAIVEPERYCLYSGKFDGGRDPFSIFAKDGSFRPNAVQFVNSLQYLRGMQRGAELRLLKASFIDAVYFTKGDWTYVALNAAGRRGDYHVTIRSQAKDVSLLDRNFNPLPLGADREAISFDLPADGLRVLRDSSGRRTQFLDACRFLTAEPYFRVRHVVLPGDERTNLIGLSLAGAPLGTSARRGTLTVLGQAAEVELTGTPQLFVFQLPKTFGTRPITNLPLEYELRMQDGAIYRDSYPLWAVTAPPEGRFPVKLDGNLVEWQGHTPVFVYASQSLDGSYRTTQARVGGHLVKELQDSSARVWARWTPEHLILAADVLDDDLQFAPAQPAPGRPGDQLVFCFDADLFGDLHRDGPDQDDFKLILGPGMPDKKAACLVAPDGTAQEIEIHAEVAEGGYRAEFAVPWERLNDFCSQVLCSPDRAPVLGFDIVLKDADKSTLLKSELAWAGYHGAEDDPVAFGQLTLLPGYQEALQGLVAGPRKERARKERERKKEKPREEPVRRKTAASPEPTPPPKPEPKVTIIPEPVVTEPKVTEVVEDEPAPERKGIWRSIFRKKDRPEEVQTAGQPGETEVEHGTVQEVERPGKGRSTTREETGATELKIAPVEPVDVDRSETVVDERFIEYEKTDEPQQEEEEAVVDEDFIEYEKTRKRRRPKEERGEGDGFFRRLFGPRKEKSKESEGISAGT